MIRWCSERIDKVTSSQMVHKLRKVLHHLRQLERISVHLGVMSKFYDELEENPIKPFFNFSNILNFSFFSCDSCQHYTCGLLIKSFHHFHRIILAQVIQVDCRNSCPLNIITVFICNNSLNYTTLYIEIKLLFICFKKQQTNYEKEWCTQHCFVKFLLSTIH